MSQQFKAMRRPLEGAPRESAGPLSGFKPLKDQFKKFDDTIADIKRRLDVLEAQGAAVEKGAGR